MLHFNSYVVFWILKSKRLFFVISGSPWTLHAVLRGYENFFENFFTGSLSGNGLEIHKLADATEEISVRTTFSPDKLSFLMNSSPQKEGLDFKIQKMTELLKYVFNDLAVGMKCTREKGNSRIIVQNFRSTEFLFLWASFFLSRNIHQSLSKIVKLDSGLFLLCGFRLIVLNLGPVKYSSKFEIQTFISIRNIITAVITRGTVSNISKLYAIEVRSLFHRMFSTSVFSSLSRCSWNDSSVK